MKWSPDISLVNGVCQHDNGKKATLHGHVGSHENLVCRNPLTRLIIGGTNYFFKGIYLILGP